MKFKSDSKVNMKAIETISNSLLQTAEQVPDCSIEDFVSAQMEAVLKMASIASIDKESGVDVMTLYRITNNTAQRLMNSMFFEDVSGFSDYKGASQ